LKRFMKILVAYDGSALADKALDEAVDLAEMSEGSIAVIHVPWEESDDESRRLLARVEARLKKAGARYELMSERSQYPPRRIIRAAMDGGFDLICVGSRGLGTSKAWVLGSVSSRVIEEAPCPVLVVK